MTAQKASTARPTLQTASGEVAKIAKVSKTAKCLWRPRTRNAPERHAEKFWVRTGRRRSHCSRSSSVRASTPRTVVALSERVRLSRSIKREATRHSANPKFPRALWVPSVLLGRPECLATLEILATFWEPIELVRWLWTDSPE